MSYFVSAGLSSSLSNPSIQASLNNCQLQSSLSNPSINSSLRLSSNSPRRRPAPISPLTLSPGAEQRRGLAKQLSPTMSPSLSPITQVHTAQTEGFTFSSKQSDGLVCSALKVKNWNSRRLALKINSARNNSRIDLVVVQIWVYVKSNNEQ